MQTAKRITSKDNSFVYISVNKHSQLHRRRRICSFFLKRCSGLPKKFILVANIGDRLYLMESSSLLRASTLMVIYNMVDISSIYRRRHSTLFLTFTNNGLLMKRRTRQIRVRAERQAEMLTR